MARRLITLPSFEGQSASQTATLRLPVGLRYFELLLELDANTWSSYGTADVRILVNGKVQRVHTVNELVRTANINSSSHLYADTATVILPIFFGLPWQRNEVGEDLFAWGTSNLRSLTLEIDLPSTWKTAGHATKIEARAWVDDAQANIGGILKARRYFRSAAGAGVIQIQDLPRIDNISRVHFFSANVTKVVCKADQLEIFNAGKTANNELLKSLGLRNDAAVFSVCFDATQRYQHQLPMFVGPEGQQRQVQDLLFEVTTDAAIASLPVLVETFGTPD